MREVELVQLGVGPRDIEFEQEVTSHGVLISQRLNLVQVLLLLFRVSFYLVLSHVSVNHLRVPFRNLADSTSFFPNPFHNLQHVLIDLPWNIRQVVQNRVESRKVSVAYQARLQTALAKSHDGSRLEIVTSDFTLDPRQRLDDGGQRTVKMHTQITLLFELGQEVVQKVVINLQYLYAVDILGLLIPHVLDFLNQQRHSKIILVLHLYDLLHKVNQY